MLEDAWRLSHSSGVQLLHTRPGLCLNSERCDHVTILSDRNMATASFPHDRDGQDWGDHPTKCDTDQFFIRNAMIGRDGKDCTEALYIYEISNMSLVRVQMPF